MQKSADLSNSLSNPQSSPNIKNNHSMAIDDDSSNFDIKSLSKNAIKTICDGPSPSIKNDIFIVQVTEVKTFSEQDNKKNIR